jgi:hypothetical protein
MKMEAILNVIRRLACSQGFYGRLLHRLSFLQEHDPEAYAGLVAEWEAQKFGDAVSFVMYVEG